MDGGTRADAGECSRQNDVAGNVDAAGARFVIEPMNAPEIRCERLVRLHARSRDLLTLRDRFRVCKLGERRQPHAQLTQALDGAATNLCIDDLGEKTYIAHAPAGEEAMV